MIFEKLKILEGNYWDIFLHQDQTAIGKLYFWYKKEAGDLLDVPKEALIEFHEIGNKIKFALSETFHPDLYNYQSLNNITNHLHIHIIPRYSKKIKLFGFMFDDFSFGKSYQSNPDFKMDEETLIQIKEKIKNNIK